MHIKTKTITTIIILVLLLVVPPIIYSYVTKGYNNFIKLQVAGEKDSNGNDHKISDFSFINQDGVVINNDSMLGNIYIADFFFTTCPTICPTMTKNMAYVQEKLSVYPNIKFLSHTVNPETDTPERFLEYIDEMKQDNIMIDLKNWDFVTGKKNEIYDVAKSYFVSAFDEDPLNLHGGGFLHTEYFILIDKEGRVRSGLRKDGNPRGAYDGTNDAQMKDLVNDVKVLMAEYKRPKRTKRKW